MPRPDKMYVYARKMTLALSTACANVAWASSDAAAGGGAISSAAYVYESA